MQNTTEIQIPAAEATTIPFRAVAGTEAAMAALLKGAAVLVRDTEPGTLQWLALRGGPRDFAIVDFFADEAGRAAHFGGRVAAALKAAAPDSVEGGWDAGIVGHVENSKVLSQAVNGKEPGKARLAARIEIRARPGKGDELAALLAGAGAVIRASEPGTLLWYGLRLSHDRFAIFDVFADEAGRNAHFAGQVAAALQAKAR